MSAQNLQLLWIYSIFNIILLVTGFYFILVTRDLIRVLIGLDLLIKPVTLSLIVIGRFTGNTTLTQSLVIISIIIEVFVIAVAAAIINRIYDRTKTLDTRKVMNLKG